MKSKCMRGIRHCFQMLNIHILRSMIFSSQNLLTPVTPIARVWCGCDNCGYRATFFAWLPGGDRTGCGSLVSVYTALSSPTPPSVLFKAMLAAEIFGLAGVVAGSSWGFLKDRRAILGLQAFATVMFGIHYGLLGAWSGAAMCAVTLVQAVASLPEQRSRATTILFWSTVPMIAVLTFLTWNGIASAGAAFGMAMATLGRWQKDTFKLRWFFVLCSLGWGGVVITPSSARRSVWRPTPCASSAISGVCATN